MIVICKAFLRPMMTQFSVELATLQFIGNLNLFGQCLPNLFGSSQENVKRKMLPKNILRILPSSSLPQEILSFLEGF